MNGSNLWLLYCSEAFRRTRRSAGYHHVAQNHLTVVHVWLWQRSGLLHPRGFGALWHAGCTRNSHNNTELIVLKVLQEIFDKGCAQQRAYSAVLTEEPSIHLPDRRDLLELTIQESVDPESQSDHHAELLSAVLSAVPCLYR